MSRDTSGFCGHYSHRSNFAFDPVCVPYCVSRNHFRYEVSSKSGLRAGSNALDQSLLYADRANDSYIPNDILQRAILEDSKASNCSNFSAPSSSVAGLRHLEKDYFVHVSGKAANSLTLLDVSLLSKRGFVLKFSEHMPLLQVCGFSDRSSLVGQSHVLCRSAYEVFHSHLIGADALMFDMRKRCETNALLEPLQKWRVPCLIADMSCSSVGSGYSSSVLCENGQLYRWNLRTGMRVCNGGRSVLPPLSHLDINSSLEVRGMRVENSLHSQVCYVSLNRQLYQYDARLAGSAREITLGGDVLGSSQSVIDSISQFGRDSHRLLLTSGLSAAVLDVRHTRSPLQVRPLPQPQNMIKRIEWTNEMSEGPEVFLGSSGAGVQILTHLMSCSSGGSARTQGQSLDLLSAASVLGTSSFGGWDTYAFPVVAASAAATPLSVRREGDRECDSVSLTGFDLLPYRNDRSSGAEDDRHQSSCLLVHQNSLGDVFAQRIKLKQQTDAEGRGGGRGTSLMSGSTAGSSSSSSVAATALDLKTLIGSFAVSGQPSPSSRLVNKLTRPQSSTAAAIQLNTPCGVRALSTGSKTSDDVYPYSGSRFASYQKQEKLLSFDVLSFSPARVRMDLELINPKGAEREEAVEEVEDVEEILLRGQGRKRRGAAGRAEPLLEMLIDQVTDWPLTLLEVWRMVNITSTSATAGGDEAAAVGSSSKVSLPLLRKCLTNRSGAVAADIVEYFTPLPSEHLPMTNRCGCYRAALLQHGAAAGSLTGSSSSSTFSLRDALAPNRGKGAAAGGEVVCSERGCPMSWLLCYRRRHKSRSVKIASAAAAASAGLGCIYRPHLMLFAEEPAASEEVDLFLTQQSQSLTQSSVLLSPLAAAIGGTAGGNSSSGISGGISLTQQSVFTHQSILNTQNTALAATTTSSNRKSAVTSDLISALSDNWDAMDVR